MNSVQKFLFTSPESSVSLPSFDFGKKTVKKVESESNRFKTVFDKIKAKKTEKKALKKEIRSQDDTIQKDSRVEKKKAEAILDELEKKLEVLKKDQNPEKKKLAKKIMKLVEKLKKLLKSGKDSDKIGKETLLLFQDLKNLTDRIDSGLKNFERLSQEIDKIQGKISDLMDFQNKASLFNDQVVQSVQNRSSDFQKTEKLEKLQKERKDFSETEKIGKNSRMENAEKSNRKERVKIKDFRKKNIKVKTDGSEKKGLSSKKTKLKGNKNDSEQKFDFSKKTAELNRQDRSFKNAVQSYARSAAPTKAHLESMFRTIGGRASFILRDGKSELKMNLNPAELGRMHLKFDLKDGVMIAKIVVSTQEAKNLFDQNLPDLQRQLQAAGVNVESLDVNFGNQGSEGFESAESSFGDLKKGRNDFQTMGDVVESGEVHSSRGLTDSQVNFIA